MIPNSVVRDSESPNELIEPRERSALPSLDSVGLSGTDGTYPFKFQDAGKQK